MAKNDRELPDSRGDEVERPDEWAERLESDGGGAEIIFRDGDA